MDAAFVSKILSMIPDRAMRTQLGAPFLPDFSSAPGGSRYQERVRHLAKFLNWLSPLSALDKEDQKILGLLNAAGRPVHGADAEDAEFGPEEEEAALEDSGADALEYMQAETAGTGGEIHAAREEAAVV
jgi:hypothetical protein